jgi:group II intron reverse transcriptase/maturase
MTAGQHKPERAKEPRFRGASDAGKDRDESAQAVVRPVDKVRELQKKLNVAAKLDTTRRFHSLRDKVCREDVLRQAWESVRKNRGAAGVDGDDTRDIEVKGVERFLAELREELVNGTYRANPVRRVWIPKGSGKLRPLGIPTVKDRVVQAALRLVIEPIFEADFEPFSFGFRPGKSPKDATLEIEKCLNFGCENVIDADIRGCFDNIPHEPLMKEVESRIADGWVLKLIRAYLRCGVMECGEVEEPEAGTPQGAVISPLLANIYLHRLDWTWAQRMMKWTHNAHLVRYADDFVILTSGDPAEPYKVAKETLAEMGLELNEEKSRVVWAEEGFDFLGFRFVRRYSGKHGKRKTFFFPSPRSQGHAREEVRSITTYKSGGLSRPPEDVVNELKTFLRGWMNYYRHANSSEAFHEVLWYALKRCGRWTRRRRARRGVGRNREIARGPFMVLRNLSSLGIRVGRSV